ncbi:response regulator, partial [Acinetobacter sp. 1475718]
MLHLNPAHLVDSNMCNQGVLSAAASGLSEFIRQKGADVD